MAKKIANLSIGVSADASKFTSTLSGLGQKVKSAFASFAKIGAAAGAALFAGAIKAAIDFESAMADVRKVVNFETPNGLKELGDELRNLSKTIPVTAEGLAGIAAAGGQLGIAAKDLKAFTETVSKISIAYDMVAAEAGDAIAKLSNVFQIPITEMEKLGDAINHLSDNTAAKAREIVESLNMIGGTSKQFGLTAQQAAALSDAFIALGKTPQKAGTAINAMLAKLGTADKQTPKFINAMESMGISATKFADMVRKDAQGALISFLDKLATIDPKKQAGILFDMFGLEYQDDVALLVGSLDEYKKALSLVAEEQNYLGSVQREFENRSATTANSIVLLKNSFVDLGIKIGDAVLPYVRNVIDIIEKFSGNLNHVADVAIPTLIQSLDFLVSSFNKIIDIINSINEGFATITSSIHSATDALTKFAGGWDVMRPDQGIVYTEEQSQMLNKMLQDRVSAQKAFEKAFPEDNLKKATKQFKETSVAIEETTISLKDLANTAKTELPETAEVITQFSETATEKDLKRLNGGLESTDEVAKKTSTSITKNFKKMGNDVTAVFDNLLNSISQIFGIDLGGFGGGSISGIFSQIDSLTKSIFGSGIGDIFGSLFDGGITGDIMSGEGILDGGFDLFGGIGDMFGGIGDFFGFASGGSFQVEGPAAGIDGVPIGFMADPGEFISVSRVDPAKQSSGSGGTVINQTINNRSEGVTERDLKVWGEQIINKSVQQVANECSRNTQIGQTIRGNKR